MTASVPFSVYQWMRANRADVASWAVWKNPPEVLDPDSQLTTAGVGEVGFFEAPTEDDYLAGVGQALRRDIVLVGLNPAGRQDKTGRVVRDARTFGCFHDTSSVTKDHRLRAVAYHWGLWGGFIVDLDTITVETSSKVAEEKLKSDAKHRDICAQLLDETLGHLEPPRHATVVFLGGSVRDLVEKKQEFRTVFEKYFDSPSVTIWHYSHRGGLNARICNATKVLGSRQDPSGLWVPGRTDRP